jgi:hypothetical protein
MEGDLQTLTLETLTSAPGKTELSLPRIDVNNTTKDTLFSLFQGFENLTFMGNRVAVEENERTVIMAAQKPKTTIDVEVLRKGNKMMLKVPLD